MAKSAARGLFNLGQPIFRVVGAKRVKDESVPKSEFMEENLLHNQNDSAEAPMQDIEAVTKENRRAFLLSVGRRAAWVSPILLTLSARQVRAAGSNPSAAPSCLGTNESCVVDSDCCSNDCQTGACQA